MFEKGIKGVLWIFRELRWRTTPFGRTFLPPRIHWLIWTGAAGYGGVQNTKRNASNLQIDCIFDAEGGIEGGWKKEREENSKWTHLGPPAHNFAVACQWEREKNNFIARFVDRSGMDEDGGSRKRVFAQRTFPASMKTTRRTRVGEAAAAMWSMAQAWALHLPTCPPPTPRAWSHNGCRDPPSVCSFRKAACSRNQLRGGRRWRPTPLWGSRLPNGGSGTRTVNRECNQYCVGEANGRGRPTVGGGHPSPRPSRSLLLTSSTWLLTTYLFTKYYFNYSSYFSSPSIKLKSEHGN